MLNFNRYFAIFFSWVFLAFMLAGCAISGSGNPSSVNHVDVNDDTRYFHDEKNVIVNYPELKPILPKERFKRSKFKGKNAVCL